MKPTSIVRVSPRPNIHGQPRRQSGVLTLVTSLIILTLSTLVTFNLSKAVLMEQKISNNDLRAKQAFEAAEAGMLAATAYLANDPDLDSDGVIDPVFDTNNDGLGDINTSTFGTGSATVVSTDISGDMTVIRVVSQGFSDDRSATRTITITVSTINPLPNMPDSPLTTRGSVVIGGSATVHNPEGHSTIWSGADIDLGSNNSTSTEVPDVGGATYPQCMDTPMTCSLVSASNRLIAGVDVIENDTSLGALSGDQFFQNFFGLSPTTYRASTATIDTTAAAFTANAHLATHEVIWVDGNVTLSGITVGCTTTVNGGGVCPAANTKPSIVIVDGNASFSGNVHFYGLLFVTGNTSSSGNTTVTGGMVIGGTASSSGGSLDIWYSSGILAATSKAGASTGSSGTWKDF
jgi:Tfp pilus assembly protein PilX